MKPLLLTFGILPLMLGIIGCSTPLTTREKGAGIGALGGAAAGGLIGSAVGRPGVGAAVGGALGLGAGALIGDQLQGQEQKQQEQQAKLDQQRSELERNRALLEELKKRNIEARETDRGVSVNLPSVVFQFNDADLTPEHIISKGFGTRFPIVANETEEGRRKNRRVEVIIEN